MAVNKPQDYTPRSSSKTPSNVWKRDSKKPRHDRSSYFCEFFKRHGHTKDFCYKLKDLQAKSGGVYSRGQRLAANVEEIQVFDDDTPCDTPSSSAPPLDQKFIEAVAREMCKVFKSAPPEFPNFSGTFN
ncbi:hypothetical protein RND81_04G165700 [Saponaria officinalis]|uniref:Uncharacterized protein n=1 Tax=Saponaria officinalis TaxID=3572 RepID=A0AAW1LNQ1_SAPOF